MRAKTSKRVLAAGTALALALTLSACDNGDDDPNGTDGDTGDNGATTTTVADEMTTLDLTTTTLGGTSTSAP